VEGHGIDVESKLWATYMKVSNGHDDDFQEWMGIIFTLYVRFMPFTVNLTDLPDSVLFSAVNFTFIIGMQPNTRDRLYALILQVIGSH
jgi:hypothetical protein